MTKSSWLAAGLTIGSAGWAQPPATSADDAMARYRTAFPPIAKLDCPDPKPGEILVCGRRRMEGERGPDRLPLPVEREPGTRIPGEASADLGGCISRCHQPVAIDLIGAARTAGKIVDHLINGDD